MFTYSPLKKSQINKNDLIQKFKYTWFLIVLLPEWSTAVFFFVLFSDSCSWVPCWRVKTFEQNEGVYIFLILPKYQFFLT